MTVEQAIKKAIEGGYQLSLAKVPCFCHRDPLCSEAPRPYDEARTFLAAHFWQSLGEALGWSNLDLPEPMYKLGEVHEVGKMWLFHWHGFIDHLASGKDAASFFAGIN